MPSGERFQKAIDLLREAYRRQMSGDLDGAVEYYQRSIAIHPTAEAHTFLGWTYSFQGNLDAAIAECTEAGRGSRGGVPSRDLAPLALHDGALLGVHLLPDAGALAEVPYAVAPALREELLVSLGGNVLIRALIRDLDAEKLLDEIDVVH